jgi:hypothetical protein
MAFFGHCHQLFPGAFENRPLVLRLMVEAAGVNYFSQIRCSIAHMTAFALRQYAQLEKHGNTPL